MNNEAESSECGCAKDPGSRLPEHGQPCDRDRGDSARIAAPQGDPAASACRDGSVCASEAASVIPTPRTDAEAHDVGGVKHDQGAIVRSEFARQLERELHLANLTASDNADWFDALVNDLAGILDCKRKPSVIIDETRRLKSRVAGLIQKLASVGNDCLNMAQNEDRIKS